MKLSTLSSHLVEQLGLSASDLTELIRALKDGSSHWKDAEGDLGAALAGKPGPRGGVDATSFHAALLLIGLMIDAPRKNAAIAVCKAYRLPVGGVDAPSDAVCGLTERVTFGAALMAAIDDPRLARHVRVVRLQKDGDAAEISYKTDSASRFGVRKRVPMMRTAELSGNVVFRIAEFFGVQDGKSRASV